MPRDQAMTPRRLLCIEQNIVKATAKGNLLSDNEQSFLKKFYIDAEGGMYFKRTVPFGEDHIPVEKMTVKEFNHLHVVAN